MVYHLFNKKGVFLTYFWDSLRPVTDFAAQIDPLVKILVFLLAAGFSVIAFMAYRKNPSKKLLFVSLAFLFFALKWLVKLVDVFLSPGTFLSDSSENVFELMILGFLFFAILKK